MTNAFQDREKGFESKWAHDEEFHFKVIIRRNKLLGLWAAKEMGIAGADADEYAKAVAQVDFLEPGHEDVVRKIRHDFDAHKVAISDHVIRRQMEDLTKVAGEQLMGEGKP
jgi:hypothetical protein